MSRTLVDSISFGGWMFLTFLAVFVVISTFQVSRHRICYYQRNLLYINSFILTIVTPLFLWTDLFVAYHKYTSSPWSVDFFTFSGRDMVEARYFILILTMQIFSAHQVINLARILYELYGRKTSIKYLGRIALYKMVIYFLIVQCIASIFICMGLLIMVDYTEHLITLVIYSRMLRSKATDPRDPHLESSKEVVGSNSTEVSRDGSARGNGAMVLRQESIPWTELNVVEDEIIARDSMSRDDILRQRAKWGIIAVVSHMISVIPLLIVQFYGQADVLWQRLTIVFGYLIIGFNLWCYKWLIIATPADWEPPISQ